MDNIKYIIILINNLILKVKNNAKRNSNMHKLIKEG